MQQELSEWANKVIGMIGLPGNHAGRSMISINTSETAGNTAQMSIKQGKTCLGKQLPGNINEALESDQNIGNGRKSCKKGPPRQSINQK